MQNQTKHGQLFVVSGSSGVGKGTILKEFMKRNTKFKLSISVTTRKPREGEQDGVNYFFVTKDGFAKSVQNGEFLEWAMFSGNCYGTKREFVERSLNKGVNLILEIDTQGAMQVKNVFPDAVSIFILPPSFEDLEKRLRGRNTESEDAIQERLRIVKTEMVFAERFDYQLVNDNIETALEKLEKIIKTERDRH